MYKALIPKIITGAVLIVFFIGSWAGLSYSSPSSNTYYLNTTSGNDSNDGLSEATAWQTISKVNSSSFNPGDQILFKKGQVWRESLLVPSSGIEDDIITFGSYGAGEDRPVINGADIINGWAVYSGSIFYKDAAWTQPAMVFMDGVKLTKGAGKYSLNDHEWFWEDRIFYLRDDSGNPDAAGVTIEAQTRGQGIENDKDYINITGFEIKYFSFVGIYNEASHVTFKDNIIHHNYHEGIRLRGSGETDLTIDGGEIYNQGDGNAVGVALVNNLHAVIIKNTEFYGQDKAITAWEAGGSSGITFQNLYCHDHQENALHLIADNSGTLNNLTITGCHFQNNGIGDYYTAGEFSYRGAAILLWRSTDSVITKCLFDSNMGWGIDAALCTDLNVRYNLFINNKDTLDDAVGPGIALESNSCINTLVYNNTFYGNSRGMYISWNYTPVVTPSIAYKNNIFYNNDSFDVANSGSGTIITEGNNLTYTDPCFVDARAGDFHILWDSPCKDAGIDVGLTEDYEGNSIIHSPDIGAYEFVSENEPPVLEPKNEPPVLEPIGDKTIAEGQLLEFTVSATDPDSDTLTYSVSNLPNGATFNSSTAAFNWLPTYTQAGVYTNITFQVTDGEYTDTEEINLTVNNVNNAPVLGAIGDKRVDEGSLLEFTVLATDPDGTLLTYSASNLPEGSTFNTSTAAFSWAPDYTQAGTYAQVHFEVSDGELTDTEKITIVAQDVNQPPSLSAIGDKRVDEGSLLEFTVLATDPDSDTLTYSVSNLPNGATFNSSTAAFNWLPTYTQAGVYTNITFQVTDGEYTDTEEINLTVNNVNNAPVLGAIGDKRVDEGSLLEFTVLATDPDGTLLTYSASNLPEGSTFNTSTAAFSWAPDYTQAGTYAQVHFEVSDGELTDNETITITVNNVNRKPAVNNLDVSPATTVSEGQSLTIKIDATDPDGDSLAYYVQNEPDGSGFVDNGFYWSPGHNQAGTYNDIIFTVFDGEFYSDPSCITIKVIESNNAPVFITHPSIIASCNGYGEAIDIKTKGDYAYVAFRDGKLRVFNISDLTNIYETGATTTYRNLSKVAIFGDCAYIHDTGNLIDILDISIPSMPSLGYILEPNALGLVVKDNIAYVACGGSISLYDITNKNGPEKLLGDDLGKAHKIISNERYCYAISEDEDLKLIDNRFNEVTSTISFQGAEAYPAEDIAISGNNVYVAKDDYGIVCFDVNSPSSPLQKGELYISNIFMKELESYNKNRFFALGYLITDDIYSIHYIDSTDPAFMSEIWAYSFSSGLDLNGLYADGNRLFVANEKGMDIFATPLESIYTVEAESELRITIYAYDSDGDDITYTMQNKPDFDNVVFTDNEDNTAIFIWTPTKAQIGTYTDVTFTACDGHQEISSNNIIINVVKKDKKRHIGRIRK